MNVALVNFYARLIYKGQKTINDEDIPSDIKVAVEAAVAQLVAEKGEYQQPVMETVESTETE